MKSRQIEQQAFEYHKSGFHCAEAVAKAVIEAYSDEPNPAVPKIASAFGGGIGGTNEDLCGALAGGLIAIGYVYGRMAPGEDWQQAKNLAAELRKQFITQYGATNCPHVLETLGPQENGMKCKKLSGIVAGIVARLFRENGIESHTHFQE